MTPRLPLEAALKLRNHSVSTQKGEKGYDRKQEKEQERKRREKEDMEDID